MSEDAGYVAIVLAAGASRRMGEGRNKLLEAVDGRALVAHAVDAFVAAGLQRIVVVIGHEADRVRASLAGRPGVEFVVNVDWADGMGCSLAAGARHLIETESTPVAGVFVTVGDLPGLPPAAIEAARAAHAAAPAAEAICLPSHAGRDGHPVLFGRDHLEGLAELAGDRGARAIVQANEANVRRVAVESDGIFCDVDTPDDLARARGAS
ncbi:MAG: nucleotidyltransferase family protein [bacterium]|nr:nucleotidyltransferase family protein [bacterium]